jgi:NAD(P)-dependent dehydrogenase (short-subunit alcohol dehydrogenase family)
MTPLADLRPRDFQIGTDLNYTSVYRMMHRAAPHLFAAAPRAVVINLVSIAAERGFAAISYCSAAKAAVTALARRRARVGSARRSCQLLGARLDRHGPH